MSRASLLAAALLFAVAVPASAQEALELPVVIPPQLRSDPPAAPSAAPVRAERALVEPATASTAVQQRLGLTHGRRVQLHLPSNRARMITADVVAFRRDGLSLVQAEERTEGGAYRSSGGAAIQNVQFRQIGYMRVSQGHSRLRSAVRGSLWGVYVAGSAGAIAGPVAAHSMGYGIGTAAAVLGGSGAVLGAAVGAVVGAIVSPERWKSYQLVSAK